MSGLNFLLEIGAEEIPDWMIEPALEQLRKDFTALLETNKISGSVSAVDASPRRLVLWAEGLPAGQSDGEELVTGPPKSAGAGAANGFAKKQGVAVDALETLTTDKGEYFSYRKQVKGRPTAQILAEALPDLILKLYFPKTMYWTGKGGARFIRPIRWIVALLGGDVVNFELAGVTSGNLTYGHRRLSSGTIAVTFADYQQKLEAGFVLVRAAERRKRILDGIAALGANVKTDEKLLHVLTYITEWPTPIVGSFDESYLNLPKEVLVMVMRHHQKYFSVEKADGSLSNQFVAVMNIDNDNEGIVRSGNERVLRARFNDAKFFWDVDQQRPLADRVADLANVTFQTKLGSYLKKTERMVELARELGGEDAARAAHLAKADLTTEMVKEFTDLQGLVGGLYARVQGEPEAVAQAIYEHYKPLSMEDLIPESKAGQALGLADKLDTLRGCFSVGMIPTGSKDPFALRRASQGVVKILIEGGWRLSLKHVLGGDAQLEEFFLDRLKYYFREIRGFKYDEVNAVLAAGWDDVVDAHERLEAIRAVRPTENFEPLAASFKRMKNIVTQASFSGGSVDAALLSDDAEKQLHEAAQLLRGKLQGLPYKAALETIAGLRPAVDNFFDKVMVNAQDQSVRNNRLALLAGLLSEFSSIADFSEIVTS